MLFISFILPTCSFQTVSCRYLPLSLCLAFAIWIPVELPACVVPFSAIALSDFRLRVADHLALALPPFLPCSADH